MTRTEQLRKIMRDYALDAPDVAFLLGLEPQTVRAWAALGTDREIPTYRLELLRLKLALRPDAA